MDIARLYWKGVTGLCSQVVHDLLDPADRHVSPEDKDNDASDRKVVRVAVVIGAGEGIGEELCLLLCERGFHVISGSPCHPTASAHVNNDRPPALAAGGRTRLHLDLRSAESIRAFAENVVQLAVNTARARHDTPRPELRLVHQNAGVMLCPLRLCENGWEEHMQVNVIGPALLNSLLLDAIESEKRQMKAHSPSPSPRVVFAHTSSITHECEALDLHYIRACQTHKRSSHSPVKQPPSNSPASVGGSALGDLRYLVAGGCEVLSHGPVGSCAHTPILYRPHRSYVQSKLLAVKWQQYLAQSRRRSQYAVFVTCDPGIVNTRLYRHTSIVFQWVQGAIGKLFLRSATQAASRMLEPVASLMAREASQDARSTSGQHSPQYHYFQHGHERALCPHAILTEAEQLAIADVLPQAY